MELDEALKASDSTLVLLLIHAIDWRCACSAHRSALNVSVKKGDCSSLPVAPACSAALMLFLSDDMLWWCRQGWRRTSETRML